MPATSSSGPFVIGVVDPAFSSAMYALLLIVEKQRRENAAVFALLLLDGAIEDWRLECSSRRRARAALYPSHACALSVVGVGGGVAVKVGCTVGLGVADSTGAAVGSSVGSRPKAWATG